MTTARRLAIVTLLLAAAPIPPALAADGAPTVVVVEPVIDVGQVPVGEAVEAVFQLRNAGDRPLEITQVRPTCGCTVAEYDEVIEPGATGTVRARVDTRSILGPNAKAITVYTNDAASPRLQLTIKSDVRPFLTLDPGYARFTSFVHRDQDQTSTQILAAPDFESLEIVKVETPQPWIRASYAPARETDRLDDVQGQQWRIDVTLAKETPVGPVADHVVVHTNHPRQGTIELPVSGFVRPMVAATPPNVSFGKVDPAEEQQWGILVRSFGSAPLRIEGVESSVSGLDARVEPIEEGQQYKLVLTPTSAMAKGPFRGQIELRTNLPQQPSVTVRLSGEIL